MQLLESPIFLRLRLQLLEVDSPSYPALLKSLYGILMLLPQVKMSGLAKVTQDQTETVFFGFNFAQSIFSRLLCFLVSSLERNSRFLYMIPYCAVVVLCCIVLCFVDFVQGRGLLLDGPDGCLCSFATDYSRYQAEDEIVRTNYWIFLASLQFCVRVGHSAVREERFHVLYCIGPNLLTMKVAFLPPGGFLFHFGPLYF